MTYYLGIDLGTTFTSASVYEGGRATVVDLAGRTATMPSVVFLDDTGTFVVGDTATRRSANDPARAAQQFKRRFGYTTPLFLGGSPFSADALSAEMLKSVIALVTQRQGGSPAGVALTYPANWGGYKLDWIWDPQGVEGVEARRVEQGHTRHGPCDEEVGNVRWRDDVDELRWVLHDLDGGFDDIDNGVHGGLGDRDDCVSDCLEY